MSTTANAKGSTARTARMRREGSCTRSLIVVADPTGDVPAEALTAGALACLTEPVEARALLNFLRSRTTGLAAQEQLSGLRGWADSHDEDVDQGLMDRLRGMYLAALPDRLRAIASGTRSGDARAVVSAAHTLAGTSGQFGHPDVAAVCQAIAADARRGVMAHAKVVELQELVRP
jgi:HPt (histidine-containing phosphotransfer) domain-containing protein